eukprot:1721613-Pyramimonas_sp.AAC.1
MDQSDAGSVGIFPHWTNRTQEVWVYSHDGPIRCRKRGFIPTMDQSDAGSVGIFPQWTDQTQEARVHSYAGPIIPCTCQSYLVHAAGVNGEVEHGVHVAQVPQKVRRGARAAHFRDIHLAQTAQHHPQGGR